LRRVFFKNKEGKNLAGLLFAGAAGRKPAVIVCHGFTGTKEGKGKAVRMAELIEKNNFAVLLFDFAGCGESEGKFEDLTLSGHVDDLTCAVDFCLENGFDPVITSGRSFGGVTSICHAAVDSRTRGVCTWAAPASLTKLFMGLTDEDLPEDENAIITMEGAEGLINLKKAFFTDLLRHDVPRCSSLISPRPLLVVQGTRDAAVPPAEASIIYEAARQPKEILFIEGADHQFSAHYDKVWEIFLNWLKTNFAG
jgi:putative redox protein